MMSIGRARCACAPPCRMRMPIAATSATSVLRRLKGRATMMPHYTPPDSSSGIVGAVAKDALALEEIDAFYGDSHVLHRVSFRLGEGRLLGLLGRNGAGKSTSMNVTVGLLAPRHGTVTVYGTAVAGRAPETIAAQGVALVPQGRRIFKSLTVRENLAVAGRKPRAGAATGWTLDTV